MSSEVGCGDVDSGDWGFPQGSIDESQHREFPCELIVVYETSSYDDAAATSVAQSLYWVSPDSSSLCRYGGGSVTYKASVHIGNKLSVR